MSTTSITTWNSRTIFPRRESRSLGKISPRQLLEIAHRFCDLEGTVLLYSSGQRCASERSFLGIYPLETLSHTGRGGWDYLSNSLGTESEGHDLPLWMGFLGYEMGRDADAHVTIDLPQGELPEAYFVRPAIVLELNHATSEARYAYWQGAGEIYLEDFFRRLEAPAKPLSPIPKADTYRCTDDFTTYCNKVKKAQELIRQGEIYQVNLSQAFTFSWKGDPFSLYADLMQRGAAPFSAWINCPGFHIISTSPERLIRKSGRLLETWPIKGTAPRGKTPEEDRKLRESLLQSEKERAELLMITDLMRNDLGRISTTASVQVQELFACDAYPNVFHLHSKVQSEALSEIAPIDLLKALFPGGSITGCPKIRAMEVIQEIEKRPRGVYTGSIGYLAGNGNLDFNIAIRTLTHQQGVITVALGGGIVADSNPAQEYQETLHKGRTLFGAFKLEGYASTI